MCDLQEPVEGREVQLNSNIKINHDFTKTVVDTVTL
jgi:hypothetical protein